MKSTLHIIALIILASLSANNLYAQTNQAQPLSTAEPSAEMLELRRAGFAANYNLDYATALKTFEEIRQRWPQHPAGDLYVANIIWLEHLYKLRRLQTGLYQNESFYSGFEDSKEDNEKGDSVEANVDKKFRALMASAKTKALTLVNANRDDAHARYFLGAVYSVLAAYEASTARKFWSALRNGSKGIDAHQQVLKMNPEYYDAYLSVGLFDYVIGSLPFPVKALIAMGGVRGNKERGINHLKTIIEHKAENADDARVMLIGIYQNEEQPEESLTILKEFTSRYPKNFLFRLEMASVLSLLNRQEEANSTFESLIKEAGTNSPAARAMDLIRFQYAEALLKNQQYEKAAQQFQAVTREQGAEPGLVTLSMLRSGQLYDVIGKRENAIAQYQTVITRPNVYDSHDRAEKGLKQPYKKL